MSERASRIALPILVLALVLLTWDLVVRGFAIPPYVLPGPGAVFGALIGDRALLWDSLLVTLSITFEGFLLAAVGGVVWAVIFNQWRLIEYSFYPYAVILQVTPVVAVAPLLLRDRVQGGARERPERAGVEVGDPVEHGIGVARGSHPTLASIGVWSERVRPARTRRSGVHARTSAIGMRRAST